MIRLEPGDFEGEALATYSAAAGMEPARWDEMRHGDAQRARFVQVMEGHVTDRVRAERLQDRMEPLLSSMRPDLLGTTTAYFDDGAYASLAYFSSEEEARHNEHQPVPDAVAGELAEWARLLPVEKYIDLTSPVLVRA